MPARWGLPCHTVLHACHTVLHGPTGDRRVGQGSKRGRAGRWRDRRGNRVTEDRIISEHWVVRVFPDAMWNGLANVPRYAAKAVEGEKHRSAVGWVRTKRGAWSWVEDLSEAATYWDKAAARVAARAFLKSKLAERKEFFHVRVIKVETFARLTDGEDVFDKGTSIVDMVATQDRTVM